KPLDITRDVVEQPHEVEAVADQRACLQVLPECRDRRNAALEQGLRDDRAIAQEYRACGQNDRLPAGILHRAKCASVALLALHFDHARLQTQLAGCLGGSIALLARKRVESDSDEGRARERLASDLNAFGGEFDLADEDAGHVAAGMREIRHITLRKRVEIDGQKRDRLTVRGGKRGTYLVSHRQEHVGLARREFKIALVIAIDIRCLDVIECKVAALLITKFGHPPEEIRIMWSLSRLHADKADAQHLVLLRAPRAATLPPRRRAA